MKQIQKLVILGYLIQRYALAVVSWDSCIVQKPYPCPQECVQAGYIQYEIPQTANDKNEEKTPEEKEAEKKLKICLPPTFSFCTSITDTCNQTQPNYYLQACIDYGYTQDVASNKCLPPVCVDNKSPCLTKTTYCADAKYVNDATTGLCNCPVPQRDWQGLCTDILSQIQLKPFIASFVFLLFIIL